MAWAENPETAAAGKAAAEEFAAQVKRRSEAAMTPFERKLIGVLEDVRDALQSPAAGPVLATVRDGTSFEACARIRHHLPKGSVLTGEGGPIVDVRPLGGNPVVSVPTVETAAGPVADPDGYFALLLDAQPEVLREAIDGAAEALRETYPNIVSPRMLAEVAIDAALMVAAAIETSVVPPTTTDGAAGGDVPPIPPADTPTSP